MKETAVISSIGQSTWHWIANEPPRFHIPLDATCAMRSAENILRWTEYLPTACVRTMVRMGWDYTT
jgi:hypothetical protein